MIRPLLTAALLAAALPASAQVGSAVGMNLGPSPRWGSFDIGVTRYRPNIDASSTQKPGPYELMFGRGYGWRLDVGVSKALFTRMGTLEAGVRTGYFDASGKGLIGTAGSYTRAGSSSDFRIVPTSATLTYRFDLLVERYGFPLALYGRGALERYNWWVTRGAGGTVEKGATNGWSVAGGAAFLLDIADPTLAREFDRDSGVNHTYLYFEVTKAKIDDFGSSKSWDLSPSDSVAYSGGVTFVF